MWGRRLISTSSDSFRIEAIRRKVVQNIVKNRKGLQPGPDEENPSKTVKWITARFNTMDMQGSEVHMSALQPQKLSPSRKTSNEIKDRELNEKVYRDEKDKETCSSGAAVAADKSKRQVFREIVPDLQLLNHLDSIKLGYLASRRERVQVARKLDREQIVVSPSLRIRRPASSPSKTAQKGQDVRAICKETPYPFRCKAKVDQSLLFRPFDTLCVLM